MQQRRIRPRINARQIAIQFLADCLLVYALQSFAMLSDTKILAYLQRSPDQIGMLSSNNFTLPPADLVGFIVLIAWARMAGLVIAFIVSLIISITSSLHWLNPLLAVLAAAFVSFYLSVYFFYSFAAFQNTAAEIALKGSLMLLASMGLFILCYRARRNKPAS